mgnify:CR=1 FL=1
MLGLHIANALVKSPYMQYEVASQPRVVLSSLSQHIDAIGKSLVSAVELAHIFFVGSLAHSAQSDAEFCI